MTQPTVQTTDAGSTVATKGVFARLTGVLFSPRETFGAVVAHPSWFAMLCLVIALTAVATGGFMASSVGQQAWLDMMEKQGNGAQQMEMMQRVAPYAWAFAVGYIVIVFPILVFAVSGILFAVFTVGTGATPPTSRCSPCSCTARSSA